MPRFHLKIVFLLSVLFTIFTVFLPINANSLSDRSAFQGQTWNLKDADIRAVIETVALATGKSFIIDPAVQGKVTFISQKPMSTSEMYQAFLSMLQVMNYSAVPSADGRVVKIVPSAIVTEVGGQLANRHHPGKGENIVLRIVPVSHVSAIQLIPVLRPLMPSWASVTAYAPSNTLILAGNAHDMQRLVALVHHMDQNSTSQVSVVNLRYADAKQVVSMLDMLREHDLAEGKVSNVSMVADSNSNSILLSGDLSDMVIMKGLIAKLDRPNSASVGNTEVIHLNYLTASKLAPVLEKIASNDSKASKTDNPVSVQAQTDDNAIIIHAPPAIMLGLESVIKKLDVHPKEILVEAIIVNIDESLLNQLGIVWGTVDLDGNPTTTANGTTSAQNSFALKLGGRHGIGFVGGGGIQALVHALMSNSAADVLSTPSIVVMNNQDATIADGKNIGMFNRQYATSSSNNNLSGVLPYNTVERKDVTLSLKVTPQISPNNILRLKINQKDDSLDPDQSGDPDNPTIDTSQITTSVMVKSGDILVLGGLANHEQKKSTAKVPVLGSIPLLGRLFQYTNHSVEKKDLMVFLRPIILNAATTDKQSVSRYHDMREQELRMQLQGEHLSADDLPVLPQIKKDKHLLMLPKPVGVADSK